jgi:hypothetical protein
MEESQSDGMRSGRLRRREENQMEAKTCRSKGAGTLVTSFPTNESPVSTRLEDGRETLAVLGLLEEVLERRLEGGRLLLLDARIEDEREGLVDQVEGLGREGRVGEEGELAGEVLAGAVGEGGEERERRKQEASRS